MNSPGRAAACSALATLRGLALDGDADAVRAICRVIALELGLDDAAPGLLASSSLTELIHDENVPALIRLYAAGYCPRDLLTDLPAWAPVTRDLLEDDLSAFHALVRRNAPVGDEVLKAYLLGICALAFGTQPVTDILNLNVGALLSVVDAVRTNARLVEGESVSAGFAYGRDTVLVCSFSTLLSITLHELGHHIVDYATRGEQVGGTPRLAPDLVRELAAVLPTVTRAAVEQVGNRPAAGDGRVYRLPDGLSVMCTLERLPGGTYTHLSLTDAGGPLPLQTAVTLAYCALRVLAADPAQAAASLSPRGIFHVGIPGEPVMPDRLHPAQSLDLTDWAAICGEAQRWYAALEAAGRVGASEADVRYMLGVAQRPVIVYALDGEQAWADAETRVQFHRLVESHAADQAGTAPDEVLTELLRLTVRCGDPAAAAVVDAGARPDRIAGLDPELEHLGASLLAVRGPDGLDYVGPGRQAMFEVLAALGAGGFDTDAVVTDDGQTLLTDAAGRSAGLVFGLLELGLHVERPNALARTALTVAAAIGDVPTATVLLKAGARVEARDRENLTPLHHAASRPDGADLVELLLAHGTDVEARSGSGRTPLLVARTPAVAGRLLAAGATLEARDIAGMTPLIAATQRRDLAVATLLLDKGADPAAVTDLGWTALHHAVERPDDEGSAGLVQALLDAGADPEEETNDGRTPLMLAARAADDARAYSSHAERVDLCLRLLTAAGAITGPVDR